MNSKRPFLLPFVPLYGAGVATRNWFFDKGVFKVSRVSVPVVSVGNVETGGVGKTPFVELLAGKLSQKGRRVAVISRGYKRQSHGTVVVSNGSVLSANASESGDEAAQMASKLQGVIVVVDELRVRGAEYAVKELGADVVILDDGFQHRALHRDVDVVVVPAKRVLDPGWLLPAGNRREPMSSLNRATVVAISRCANVEQFQNAREAVGRWTEQHVIGLTTKVSAFRRATSRFSLDLAGLKGKSVVAFSGVGNPQSFEQTITSLGLDLKKHAVFPDHHEFTVAELQDLESSVPKLGADYLVTTEKDIARLGSGHEERRRFVEQSPLFFIEIEQQVLDAESVLNEIIDGLLKD